MMIRVGRIMIVAALLLAGMAFTPARASAHSQGAENTTDAPPLLSVGDVDGSGLVDDADVGLVRDAVRSGVYGSLYDRNGDHRLTNQDIRIVRQERGQTSTAFDRQLVEVYLRFAWTQTDAWEPVEETLLEFGPVWGEGMIKLTESGRTTYFDFGEATLDELQIAVGPDDERPWGLRFSRRAVPAFDNPLAQDFPLIGGIWENSNVIRLFNVPPQLTVSPDERWIPNVAQCWAKLDTDEIWRTQSAIQWTQCRDWPSDADLGRSPLWFNTWAMTMWIYHLNPLGLFAPIHPELTELPNRLDTGAPDTFIESGPAATSAETSAAIEFTGVDYDGSNGGPATSTVYGVSGFECQLDGAGFDSCSSPVELTDLTNGSHTFEVRAVDYGTNVDGSPASHTWTVDAPLATCGGYAVIETSPGAFAAPGYEGNLIVGTDGRDRLVGTNGPDMILGLAGNDFILAKSSNDIVCGGSGRDAIFAGSGDDEIHGGEQNDLLLGQAGNDTIDGDGGRDALFGGRGNDDLDGGADRDRCRGGSGNDTTNNCER